MKNETIFEILHVKPSKIQSPISQRLHALADRASALTEAAAREARARAALGEILRREPCEG